jgi:hypothetical protein
MAEGNVTPSFSDGRVIVVRADDSADCATFWDESQAGCEQTAEGPTHLVIGTYARDTAINRMAARFGIPAADLLAFRDGEEQAPESLAERFTQGEAPKFHVVRRCRDVRLWKSTTTEHTSFGQVRHAAVHFHITRGAKIVLNHMPELYEHALPNFNAVCQQYA